MTGEFTSDPAEGMQQAIADAIRTMDGEGTRLGLEPEIEVDFEAVTSRTIEQHVEPLEDFEPYRDEVTEIERLVREGRPLRTIPGYVGKGGEVGVFRVGNDGRRVAKVLLPGWDPLVEMEALLQAFLTGRGVSGLAQIRSFSESKPHAIIVDYVPGDKLSAVEARRKATFYAYLHLIRHVYPEMQRRGLATDNADSENIILTPQGHLEIVDYDYDPRQPLVEKVITFGSNYCLLEGEDYPHHRLPAYARRYREACRLEYGEEVAERLNFMWRSYGIVVDE
jgi:hypothetical protein